MHLEPGGYSSLPKGGRPEVMRACVAVCVLSTALLGFAATARPTASAGDPTAGKKIFLKFCGGCHALRAAHTHGRIDLDEIRPTAKHVVCFVTQGYDQMPPFGKNRILTPRQITDVAAFVSMATRPNTTALLLGSCGGGGYG